MRTEIELGVPRRSSVGLDRTFDTLRSAMRVEPTGSHPRRDVERTGEDARRATPTGAGSRPDGPTVAT